MVSVIPRAAVAPLVAILMASVLSQSMAEPMIGASDPRGELTLAAAIDAALSRNPDLQSAVYELRAADARITQARVRPNPELDFTAENFAGTGSAHGTSLLESTLSLGQVIELGGKQERRLEVATSERDAAAIERDARQLDVLAEVTRRFLQVVSAQEQLLLARRASDLAVQTAAVIGARVEAARSPEAEESRARIAVVRARVEQQRAERELQIARRALAATWGSTEPLFETASADLYARPVVVSFESLEQRLERNPELLRFASEARLREAQLRLARAEAVPSLTLSAGLRHLNETDDTAVVAGFSLPLHVFDRRQGAIGEAEARHAQALAAQQAGVIRVSTTLFELYQGLEQAGSEAAALHAEAIPQAEAALAQSREGYERGRFSYLELATAQQELIELRRAEIEAAAKYHDFLTEIERLTNEPLTR